MSGFANIALPGGIPTSGGGRGITPESLFKHGERAKYEKLLDSYAKAGGGLDIKNVSVRIFDLSDKKERKEYEKLWAKLLVKVSKGEAVVDSSKDLVHRTDGTSYWMKYVEYVEFNIVDSRQNRSEQ